MKVLQKFLAKHMTNNSKMIIDKKKKTTRSLTAHVLPGGAQKHSKSIFNAIKII